MHDYIIITKLNLFGIRGGTARVISLYLKYPKHFVNHNSYSLSLDNMKRDVSQGSILGPLLLILHMNDIFLLNKQAHHAPYADDVNIFLTCTYAETVVT